MQPTKNPHTYNGYWYECYNEREKPHSSSNTAEDRVYKTEDPVSQEIRAVKGQMREILVGMASFVIE